MMGRLRTWMFLAPILFSAPVVLAQAPQIELEEPPGVPNTRGRLGPAIGASGTSSFEDLSNSGRPIGGRPGPSVSRAPIGGLTIPTQRISEGSTNFRLPRLPEAELPIYETLDLPTEAEDLGPPDGLTLDGAIERLVQRNLSLMALRYEVPMAEADVLTAGLRANPIFYADSQLVPYGKYTNQRPGGQRQFDVNVTIPLDISGKRRARTVVAKAARKVTEAQFQDAVRLQIDNLYTAYVDTVAAGETVVFSQSYVRGVERLLDLNRKRLEGGLVTEAVIDRLKAQYEQGQLDLRESEESLVTATRILALLLGMSPQEANRLQLRAALRDTQELPSSPEAIINLALSSRPDLLAFRLGVERSTADIRLAKANRYPDVYLLYQPYTFQDNSPFGLKSAYSWAAGVTAAMPLFNRNQGNIARAHLNQRQTQIELQNMQLQVAHEAETAIREFQLSRRSVLEIEREVLPAHKRVRDTALRRFEGGATDSLDYLEAQREYNQVVRKYRDTLVRHRRAMLDLNTAVGTRVLP